jgi:hypothetical protein
MDLFELYCRSEFIHLQTPLKVDNSAAQHTNQDLITLKENTAHKPYILDIGTGQNFICLGYKVYDNGKYGPLDPQQLNDYNCMYCLIPFDDLSSQSEVMGIPIKRETRGKQCIYHMVDIFCCIRCMYAEYKRRIANKLYSQSESLISEIFIKYTGKSPSELKAASDYRVLEIFNGPMTWEDYHSDSAVYQRPENVFYIPVGVYLPNTS